MGARKSPPKKLDTAAMIAVAVASPASGVCSETATITTMNLSLPTAFSPARSESAMKWPLFW